jgi:hypothetical protein
MHIVTIEPEPLVGPQDFRLAKLTIEHFEPFTKSQIFATVSIIQLECPRASLFEKLTSVSICLSTFEPSNYLFLGQGATSICVHFVEQLPDLFLGPRQ